MMVPIDPAQKYLGKIDKKMNSISKSNIKADQKVKLYNAQLDNYLLNNTDEEIVKGRDSLPKPLGYESKKKANRLSIMSKSTPEFIDINESIVENTPKKGERQVKLDKLTVSKPELSFNDETIESKMSSQERNMRLNRLSSSKPEIHDLSKRFPKVIKHKKKLDDSSVRKDDIKVQRKRKKADLSLSHNDDNETDAFKKVRMYFQSPVGLPSFRGSNLTRAPIIDRVKPNTEINRLFNAFPKNKSNTSLASVAEDENPFDTNVDMMNASALDSLTSQFNTSFVPERTYIKNESKNPFETSTSN